MPTLEIDGKPVEVAPGTSVIEAAKRLGDRADWVVCDVTDDASVDAAVAATVKRFGALHLAVNSAGTGTAGPIQEITSAEFERVMATNLTGAFRVIKRASKGMLKARFGRIVLISSVVGLYGSPGQVNYAASKAALVGMARSLTRELGARNITTNVVAPGFIQTDMTDELSEAQQAEYRKTIPLGRFATPVEVAKVVTWLAGDDAGYISGAVIPVDGGLGMGH